MPVSSGEVIDFANTTSGLARQVIADNDISGAGTIIRYTNTPGNFSYITTENSDDITTEGNDLIITQT